MQHLDLAPCRILLEVPHRFYGGGYLGLRVRSPPRRRVEAAGVTRVAGENLLALQSFDKRSIGNGDRRLEPLDDLPCPLIVAPFYRGIVGKVMVGMSLEQGTPFE